MCHKSYRLCFVTRMCLCILFSTYVNCLQTSYYELFSFSLFIWIKLILINIVVIIDKFDSKFYSKYIFFIFNLQRILCSYAFSQVMFFFLSNIKWKLLIEFHIVMLFPSLNVKTDSNYKQPSYEYKPCQYDLNHIMCFVVKLVRQQSTLKSLILLRHG